MTFPFDGDTPTLSEAIQEGIEAHARTQNTALPARVTAYDPSKGCVTVQPTVQNRDGDGNTVPYPPLACVPIMYPRGGGFEIVFPLASGDTGLVVFTSASISKWLSGAPDKEDPDSRRRGSLTDAVFIPGLSRLTTPPEDPQGALVIKGTGTIKVDGGVVELAGGASAVALAPALMSDLTKIAADLVTVFAAAGAGVPTFLTPSAAIPATRTKGT